MKKWLLVLIISLIPIVGRTATIDNIVISNQESFDKLPTQLRNSIKKGCDVIDVQLLPGKYTYGHNFLNISNVKNKDLTIRIHGNGSTMYPKLEKCSPTIERMNYNCTLFTQDKEVVNTNQSFFRCESLVEVIDEKNKECRLKCPDGVSYVPGMQIKLTEWYLIGQYSVDKIENGYLYFVADDLSYDTKKKCFNVNYDYSVAKEYPRVSMLYVPEQYSNVYESINSMFLVLYQSEIKSLLVEDLVFIGSNDEKQLFQIRSSSAEIIEISRSSFRYIYNTILKVEKSQNVHFTNNSISNCFGRGVWARFDSRGIVISNNSISRDVLTIDKGPVFSCDCSDFLIDGNRFVDFGASAIWVGIKYTQKIDYSISGIVENNMIKYTDSYANHKRSFSLIDGGAIYVTTQNDRTIIRSNYIDNYTGVNSNRSIYCDDGAYNVSIYGNVIRQVDDNYAVFSWRCKGADTNCPLANSGIEFCNNIIWGKVKIEARDNSNCIRSKNIIINDDPSQIIYKNFKDEDDDVFLDDASYTRKGKIKISRRNKKKLKELPMYDKLKLWI